MPTTSAAFKHSNPKARNAGMMCGKEERRIAWTEEAPSLCVSGLLCVVPPKWTAEEVEVITAQIAQYLCRSM